MASGSFFGGVAEGLKSAHDMAQAEEALDLRRQLGFGELDARNRGLDLQERQLGQERDLRTRALDLQAQGQKNAQARALLAEADKQVSDTLSVVNETITSGKNSNADPLKVAQAIQPLVESAKRIAKAGGLNPALIDMKVNAWMAGPTATEAAVAGARTKVQAAKAVAAETGVPEREAMEGQGLVKREPRGDNTMETLRTKLAAGETLTAGEQKVYDDAIRSDPLARFLALTQAGGATPAAATAAPAAAETLPPEAVKQLKEGVVTTFQNGQKWTLKGGKPTKVP